MSVGAGAEGGVQALRAKAGGEGPPWGEAILPGVFQGVGGGAGVVGWSYAQEVGKHQVFFVQESALVVGSGALCPAQQLKEFCKNRSNKLSDFDSQTGEHLREED